MKKKGFTLVELLAVIAILAILVIIALPNVLKMYNDSKKNAFLTEVKSLYNSASSKYISESLKGNKLSEINSNDSSKLDLNGNKLTYKIKLNSDGSVASIAVKKWNYCIVSSKDSSKITKSDVSEDCESFNVLANWYEECKDKNTLRCKMLSDNETYDDSVKSKYVTSNTGINFKEISSDTNGKGLYYTTDLNATDENNDGLSNRIYYYRGDINNNYVVLGDKCYKIIRTTENGNVKLMYHDKVNTDGTCNEQKTKDTSLETSGYNYKNAFDNTYVGYMYGNVKLRPVEDFETQPLIENKDLRTNNKYYSDSYTFKNGKYYLSGNYVQGKYNQLCNNNNCKIKNYYTCNSNTKDQGCDELYQVVAATMYRKVKSVINYSVSSGKEYGSSFKYENGEFKIDGDIKTGSVGPDSDLCNPNSCSIVNYYFTISSDFLFKVVGYSSNGYLNVERLSYGTTTKEEALSNKNDSTIKKVVDSWYKNNIETKNLSSKIADEIYCNDRSQVDEFDKNKLSKMLNEELKDELTDENATNYGFNNKDELTNYYLNYYYEWLPLAISGMNYSAFSSEYASKYRLLGLDDFFESLKDMISLVSKPTYKCKNKTDRFTTTSLGNGKLKYPVALLTADEINYAGLSTEKEGKSFVNNTLDNTWTMTSYLYNHEMGYGAYNVVMTKKGKIGTGAVVMSLTGDLSESNSIVIPVLALKSDTEITKGNGTLTNPYVIK
mgnify:FL=1